MKKSICLLATAVVVAFTLPTGAVELIQNGTFEAGFQNAGVSGPNDFVPDLVPVQGWSRYETFSGGIAEWSLLSNFGGNGPSAPGQSALFSKRAYPENASGDFTSAFQGLNIDMADYSALSLSLDVMVVWHNLVAGGWVAPAFEWPVVVQVAYTDTANQRQFWRYGWYLQNPGDGPPGPVNDPGGGIIPFYNDMMVPANAWVPNTFDLMKELPQAQTIDQILVGGSGWQFEGAVDNVSLLGTPTTTPDSTSTLSLLGLSATTLAWIRRRWA